MVQIHEPVEQTETMWHNQLDYDQMVDIFMGEAKQGATRFRFKPGQRRAIPSRYDTAIHRVHNGVIVGGLAPQLVKVDADEVLDPSLDPKQALKKDAQAAAIAALQAKVAAEAALVVAVAAAPAAPAPAAPAAPPVKK